MFILHNIIKTMDEKKITQKELCNALGINQQAFTNWKNENNTSYKKHLPQIAEILDVSIDYLLGKEQKDDEHFTRHEKQVIHAYRESDMQDAVDRILGIEKPKSEEEAM